jgi:hypothetical protein
MAFDENKYKAIFESRYGSGSFESGLSQARDIGRSKVQADLAMKALKQQQERATKRTYQDSINYWNDPLNKASLKKDGAHRRANDILNDPTKQADIEAQGFNVNEYIDGMYYAASDGKFRSQREYGQHSDSVKSQAKSEQKAFKEKHSMSGDEYFELVVKPKKEAEAKKKKDKPFFTDVKDFFTSKDTDEDGRRDGLLGALEIIDRPWDALRTGIKEKAEGNGFWEGAKDGFTGKKDTSGKEVNQSLGFDTSKGLPKKIAEFIARGFVGQGPNGQVYSPIANDKIANKAGTETAGVVTEMALDPLNLLGAGAVVKGIKGIGKGAKALNTADEVLGLPAPQLRLNAPQQALPAPAPIEPSFNTFNRVGTMPNGLQSPIPSMPSAVSQRAVQDNFQQAGLGFAQQGKYTPQARGLQQPVNTGRYERELLGQKADSLLNNINKVETSPTGSFERRLLEIQNEMKMADDPVKTFASRAKEYTQEFKNAVQKQYEYLKKTMAKGSDRGTTSNGLAGNFKQVTGTYNVSKNSKWYQEFYRLHGRKPNNSELRTLAEQHVRNGFQDELGDIPAFLPKGVQEIDNQLDEIAAMLDENPGNEEVLAPIIQALEEDRLALIADFNKAINGETPARSSVDELYNATRKSDDPENFDDLVKLNQLETNYNRNKPTQGPREATIKDALDQDPRIKESIKGLYPAPRPEPSVSRPATLDEMVNNLKVQAPPKQPDLVPQPLEFKRDKGFNPDLVPNIKNRGQQPTATENPNLLLSLNPTVLKTVKTNKSLGKMSKEELQTVRQQLEQKLTSSKGKGKKKVEEDLAKVDEFMMKLNLQQFGAKTPKSEPVKTTQKKSEVKEPETKQAKQDFAISQSKQKELVKEFEKKGNPVKTEAAKDLASSDKWTDKNPFLYGRETMTRNFESTMGKDAPKMIAKYIDPVKSGEAERVRFLNKERAQVKSHGIKPKSNEDKLVQMYGEKKITLAELKQKTPEWKKVVKVAESYRNKYDELLNTVNKALVESGHTPIPKRADYFPHYEEMDGLLKQFGLDVHNHSLPTDINGLTENFRPTKQYFQFGNQRKGDETTFGAIQGFDKYIEGASNLIYHTKNIRQLRALEDVIRAKYGDDHLSHFVSQLKEYTNQLAGKKAKVDRVVEEAFGRTVFNVADTVRRRVGANMIGANISSALTGFIPTTQALATTNKASMVKGLAETMSNIRKNDGFIQKSDFLTKRIGSDPLYRTLWDKTVDKSMWMMRTVDSFNAQVIVRGKYHEGIKKGLSKQQALKQADEFAARVMAARSKGEMPTYFGSKTFGIVSQFQLEVNNQVSHIFKDIPASAASKKALASSVGQLVLYSYLLNNVYEKVVGRRPAFDPIGIAFQSIKDYNNENLTKGEATLNTAKGVLNTLPFASVATGGRFPITAAVPKFGEALSGKSTFAEELSKPLTYLALPAGGTQLKKTYDGLKAMDLNPFSPQETTGVYKNGKLQYPVEDNIANKIRAPLFGKNAFPETKEFYDNKQKALSEKQTLMVEQNPEVYENILFKRQMDSIKKKIKEIQTDQNLSEEEKLKKLAPLFKQLQGG